jgi:hypothetical protein
MILSGDDEETEEKAPEFKLKIQNALNNLNIKMT